MKMLAGELMNQVLNHTTTVRLCLRAICGNKILEGGAGGVGGDEAPLVVADLWLRRRRSLALANGEARAASAEGCRAVAAIEGSMVSPRRE